jgi:hypothetical protein
MRIAVDLTEKHDVEVYLHSYDMPDGDKACTLKFTTGDNEVSIRLTAKHTETLRGMLNR